MNTLKALAEHLETVAPAVGHVSEQQTVPYIHFKQLPGVPTGSSWERVDRVQIEIFSEGYDSTKELADVASELLTGYADTSQGFIDSIDEEIPFWHEAMESDTINKFTGTYLCTFRT